MTCAARARALRPSFSPGAAVPSIVTSSGPATLSVTLDRHPGRSVGVPISEGEALSSGTRRIARPKGAFDIRLEALAGTSAPGLDYHLLDVGG